MTSANFRIQVVGKATTNFTSSLSLNPHPLGVKCVGARGAYCRQSLPWWSGKWSRHLRLPTGDTAYLTPACWESRTCAPVIITSAANDRYNNLCRLTRTHCTAVVLCRNVCPVFEEKRFSDNRREMVEYDKVWRGIVNKLGPTKLGYTVLTTESLWCYL